MMKITIFGLTLSSSWGNGHATPYRALIGGLHRLGHRVTFFEQDAAYYAAHRDLAQPKSCELVLYSSWESVRERAMRETREADAVIVGSYVAEGARICDEVLGLHRPLRVFYDLDTPITLRRLRDGKFEHLKPRQIPEFDLYLSFVGGKILNELREDWYVRFAAPLYGCVDPEVHHRVAPRPEWRNDLSYMGTYAPDRQEKLDMLLLEASRRMPARRFVVAGSLYPWQWEWGENVLKLEHIAPQEHPAFYSSSRLTLNITRADMAASGYCPSGRFFEAAACGTPVVTDHWDGLEHFFTPGEELLPVGSAEEVISALELSDHELGRIARRAHERTLAEHTGDVRARELVRYLDEAAAVERPMRAEVA